MKIESGSDSYIGSVASGPQKSPATPAASGESAAAAGVAASAKPQAGVMLTLSSVGQTMSSTSGTSSDVFNAQKVEAFKLSIANGTFQVNAEAIADKMLSNVGEMLGSARN